jgi:tetratricopeptide (TPR) repeat protein
MGDYDEAIKYYNKILEFDPEEPLGFSNRSYNLYKLCRLKDAMKEINKFIEIYPANSFAYKLRALIHLRTKRIKKAYNEFSKLPLI